MIAAHFEGILSLNPARDVLRGADSAVRGGPLGGLRKEKPILSSSNFFEVKTAT